MSFYIYVLTWAVAFASSVQAHIAITFPPPFYAAYNKDTVTVDSSITSPLSSDGSNFPCKGKDGTPLSPTGPGGASQVTWSQGESANFSTGTGAIHGGGSCQVSLSFDQGKSFNVIHSYIGDCPTAGGTYDFKIPNDSPTGPAVFLWTWYNKIGNRETYADCSAITITASGSSSNSASTKRQDTGVAYKDRPTPFLANLGNGCKTVESTNVEFPNPGPDITRKASDKNTFTGTCGPVKGYVSGTGGSTDSTSSSTTSPIDSSDSAGTSSGASSIASSPSADASSPSSASSGSGSSSDDAGDSSGQCVGSCRGTSPSAPDAADSASVGFDKSGTSSIVSTSSSTPSAPPAAVTSSTPPYSNKTSKSTSNSTSNSTLIVSPNGSCSVNSYTCNGSPKGSCCSKWGYCGTTDEYCGSGCQSGFGTCGSSSSNTNTTSILSSSSSNSSAIFQTSARALSSSLPDSVSTSRLSTESAGLTLTVYASAGTATSAVSLPAIIPVTVVTPSESASADMGMVKRYHWSRI